MSKRLFDKKNIRTIIKNTKSFSARSYGLTIMRIMYGLIGVLALLILAIQATTGVIQADITKATVDNLAISIMFIAGALAMFAVFFMFFILKLKKIIMVSEFQNMIFTRALRNDSDYCIILTENNEIIYMDEAAQQLFNASTKEGYKKFSLNNLFANNEHKDSFFKAIKNKVSFTLSHQVDGIRFSAFLEPLKSIEGFLLLRAKTE